MYKVSKTYSIVTPESTEHGDYAETGWEFEQRDMDLEETMHEIRELGYFENFQPNSLEQSLYAIEPDSDYRTGEDTYYALHIEASEMEMKILEKELAGRRVL